MVHNFFYFEKNVLKNYKISTNIIISAGLLCSIVLACWKIWAAGAETSQLKFTWFKQSHNEAKLRVVLAPRSADFMDISNILPERVGAAGQKKCILSPSPSSCTSSVQNWTHNGDLLGYIQNLMTGKAKSLSPNPSTKSLVLSFKNKGPTEDPTP